MQNLLARTVATRTLVNDERLVVRHDESRENDWALHISDLNKSADAGFYQCQTSGDTVTQLQAYQLNIVGE